MFTVILESVDNERLDSVGQEGNAEYLPQDDEYVFKMLGDLATCAYDVFGSNDMKELLIELEQLKSRLFDFYQINHIEEIIQLAERCQTIEHSRLIFTPFEK
ncbi:hypothetical protein ACE3MZ_13670 [Paenibacillus sp. WLX1005]|uniref:hypothetical protein n=1 Tax=Paenibacillus sp. WLX1005 TaxID=3243766 RepID=UPI003984504F